MLVESPRLLKRHQVMRIEWLQYLSAWAFVDAALVDAG